MPDPGPERPATPQPADHPEEDQPITKISVVCTGNICRSPMGEVMLAQALRESNNPAHQNITVNSCGLGDWHVGDGADPRAVDELKTHGYDGSKHVAATFGPEHADADLFLAMDKSHASGLKRLGIDPLKIHLFRAFDPASVTVERPHPEVADPYYDSQSDFEEAAREIEAAVPGILEFLDAIAAEGGNPTE